MRIRVSRIIDSKLFERDITVIASFDEEVEGPLHIAITEDDGATPIDDISSFITTSEYRETLKDLKDEANSLLEHFARIRLHADVGIVSVRF
jgi:hypothetical protein